MDFSIPHVINPCFTQTSVCVSGSFSSGKWLLHNVINFEETNHMKHSHHWPNFSVWYRPRNLGKFLFKFDDVVFTNLSTKFDHRTMYLQLWIALSDIQNTGKWSDISATSMPVTASLPGILVKILSMNADVVLVKLVGLMIKGTSDTENKLLMKWPVSILVSQLKPRITP